MQKSEVLILIILLAIVGQSCHAYKTWRTKVQCKKRLRQNEKFMGGVNK